MSRFFKFCPNCTSENHTFENSHKFECLDCGFVYYHNVAAAVMVIIHHQNKILFSRRNIDPAKGKLDFPGGFVDPTENAQQAAVRELQEELGLNLSESDLNLIHTEANDYLFRDIPYRTLDVVFEVFLNELTEIQLELDEIQEIVWLEKSEIDLDEIGFNSMKKVVQKFILDN